MAGRIAANRAEASEYAKTATLFRELGISTGEESRKTIPTELTEAFTELMLPEGLSFIESEDERGGELVVAPDADKKSIKEWLKEEKPDKKDC